MECVITGCALLQDGQWVSGDLFRHGDTFVFNGNIDENNQPAWQGGAPFYERQFKLTDWFERRGVFVFHSDDVSFNVHCLQYMKI